MEMCIQIKHLAQCLEVSGFVTTRALVVQAIFEWLKLHMLQYRQTALTTQNILAMETSCSQNVWQLIGHL